MNIKVKRLSPLGIIPTRGTAFSAGLDLYVPEETLVPKGSSILIPLGIAVEIPEGYVGLIYPRSGLAIKHRLSLPNSVGVIDSDYRGELHLALVNDGEKDYLLAKGERAAQMVVTPYLHCDVEEVETLEETVRGTGGFGSTGKK